VLGGSAARVLDVALEAAARRSFVAGAAA